MFQNKAEKSFFFGCFQMIGFMDENNIVRKYLNKQKISNYEGMRAKKGMFQSKTFQNWHM